tara:strand:+ start:193 stop:501 length:309 start_codon:yes stop_codon:yes gene_type:complete
MNKEEDTAPKFSDLAQLTYQNGVKLDGAIEVLQRIAKSNVDIVKYKKMQKTGDIAFRRKAARDNTRSTILNMFSIFIACTALAISLDSSFVVAFFAAFKEWL